jgi:hypothetical protein
MVRAPLALMLVVVLLAGVAASPGLYREPAAEPEPETAEVANGPLAEPQDWMNNQRAFPQNTVGFGAWEAAVADAKAVGRATARLNPKVAEATWTSSDPPTSAAV